MGPNPNFPRKEMLKKQDVWGKLAPLKIRRERNTPEITPGGVAERLIATVLKTVDPQGSGGSNPSSSVYLSLFPDKGKGFFIEGCETPKLRSTAFFINRP